MGSGALIESLLASPRTEREMQRWAGRFQGTPTPDPMPERGLLVCHTPRAGSWWLAGLTDATGMLGITGEALNPGSEPPGPPAGFRDHLHRSWVRGSTPNGVGAMKVNLRQALPFLAAGALPAAAPTDLRWVLLTRDDVLAQAVSWQRAATTGSWRSDLAASGEAVFDEAAIGEKVRELRLQEEGWESLFEHLGIRPLRLTYERLRADPLGTVRAIAAHLGVTLTEPLAEPVLSYERQHDLEKDAWIRRLDPTRARSDVGR